MVLRCACYMGSIIVLFLIIVVNRVIFRVLSMLYLLIYIIAEGKARTKFGNNTKLLEQPIPASFLKLEKRIRELAVQCRSEDRPTLLRETVFK